MDDLHQPEESTYSTNPPQLSPFLRKVRDIRFPQTPRQLRERRDASVWAAQFGTLLVGICIGMFVLWFITSSSLPGIVRFRKTLGVNPGVSFVGNSAVSEQGVTVQETSAVIDATKKVYPAVVSITVSQQVRSYYGQVSTQEVAQGSGFIISSNGLVMTNKHVVSEAGSTYKVVLSDGRVLDAKVQATDPFNDLAVLKVDATDLPVVELGSSDSLQIGQSVFAVGNALGEFKNSVTTGIISAKNRTIEAGSQSSAASSEQLTDLLQTDAAINPGNSGGPLVNLEGQVVGINTAIASTTGGSVGIGFAIPIDSVKPVIASVTNTGSIERPYLGVRYQIVNKALQQLQNLPVDYGALIAGGTSVNDTAVVTGSPAAAVGIKEGDIILSINGDQINEDTSLQRVLQKHQIGEEVTLLVMRGGNQTEIKVTLGKQ